MALKKIDTVTRWRKSGVNADGESEYEDPPSEITVRWENDQKSMEDSTGKEFMTVGIAYSDQSDFQLEDRLANSPVVSADLESSFVVRRVKLDRNGTGTKKIYTAYLANAKQQ